MLFKWCFLILAICARVVLLGVSITSVLVNPNYPEKCWWPSSGKAYSADEFFYDKENCLKITCMQGNYFEEVGCGVIGDAPEGCKLVSNKSLNNPDCCPTFSCKKHKKTQLPKFRYKPKKRKRHATTTQKSA